MTVSKYELKRGKNGFIIWTVSIVFVLLICIVMFPELSSQADTIEQMYAQMGSMTEAFGMDRISMSDGLGFYGVECGNMLGLGGAFFAALLGIAALANEEKNRTSEFLLTRPISRSSVVTQKIIAMLAQIVTLNVICAITSYVGFLAVGEKLAMKEYALLHIAYLVMHLEIAFVCLCISSFIRKGGLGIGIGIAMLFYFLNIIANLSNSAKFLKYITPFGYTEAADIICDSKIDIAYLSIGLVVTAISIVITYLQYNKKDINA